MNNKQRLNKYAETKGLRIKFYLDKDVDNTSVETLCDEALTQLRALDRGELKKSKVGNERLGDQ